MKISNLKIVNKKILCLLLAIRFTILPIKSKTDKNNKEREVKKYFFLC